MVISFNLGDSLRDKLLNLGFDKNEAKEFVNEIDNSLEQKIEKTIEDKTFKDLATKDDIKELKTQIEKVDNKIEKLLYILIGFMSSLVIGLIFLIIRFGNSN